MNKENFKDLEIHSLICNRDVVMAINNFKSLQKFDEFKDVIIYLHDDGSLSGIDKDLLSKISNVVFIERVWADTEIEKFLVNHPKCKEYRLGGGKINLWHKIKSFDYFYFSKTKKVLGMDTDLLFMRRPEEVINLINQNTPFYYPDIQSAYCYNEPKDEIPTLRNVNTGLIFIPSGDYYDIDAIENALSNLIRNGVNYFPSWIEQSAFAHMFYVNGKYVSLPIEKYRIPYFQNVDIELVECLHFVSYPAVRDTYQEYIDYLKFDGGLLVYEKSFKVDFKEHQIPLDISIFKHEEYLSLKYYWGLEKTNQKFLDHFFRINIDNDVIEKRFQSNKTGFFIFKTTNNPIKIEHTYSWYEDVNWEVIDMIVLT